MSEELHEVCTGATARWLTPPEQDAWIALVGVLVKLPPALDGQLLREAGLNTFAWNLRYPDASTLIIDGRSVPVPSCQSPIHSPAEGSPRC